MGQEGKTGHARQESQVKDQLFNPCDARMEAGRQEREMMDESAGSSDGGKRT